MNEKLATVMQWVGITHEELVLHGCEQEAHAFGEFLARRHRNDPEYRKLCQWRQRFGSMLFGREKRVSVKTRRTSCSRKLCGADLEEVRRRLEGRFYSAPDGTSMTWQNHGKGKQNWVLDHIKPVCLFDWWTHEGRRQAWHPDNLQPLWYRDHMVKCVEDRVLERLRKMGHPGYAARIEKWRNLAVA